MKTYPVLYALAVCTLTTAASYGQNNALRPGSAEAERALREYEQGSRSTRSKTPKGSNVLKDYLPDEPRDWATGDIGLLGRNAKILQIVSKDKMLIVAESIRGRGQRIVMLSGLPTEKWTDGGVLYLAQPVEITGTTTYTTVNDSTNTVLLLECNSKRIKEIKAKLEADREAERKAAEAKAQVERNAAEAKAQVEKKRLEAAEAAKWRKWTDATGQHEVEAKFRYVISGKVKLTKRDGSQIEVPLEMLSDEDREWIANRTHSRAPK